jgi:hypothetical protein
MHAIFKVINLINNNTYVGLTNKSVALSSIMYRNTKLRNDILKYGFNNFEVIIIKSSKKHIKPKIKYNGEYNGKCIKNNKKIRMYKHTFSKVFDSIKSASEYIMGNPSRIRKVCNTKNYAYGFQWELI